MLLQVPPSPPATTQAAPPASAEAPVVAAGRIFTSGSGVIFNAIKPAGVVDFEIVLGRLRQALATSTDPVRRSQAAGWKTFKAAEAGPGGSVLYIFVIDPAVQGTDYGVARILAEAFPDEAQELYRRYIGAFAAGQTLLNLQPLTSPPAAPTP